MLHYITSRDPSIVSAGTSSELKNPPDCNTRLFLVIEVFLEAQVLSLSLWRLRRLFSVGLRGTQPQSVFKEHSHRLSLRLLSAVFIIAFTTGMTSCLF